MDADDIIARGHAAAAQLGNVASAAAADAQMLKSELAETQRAEAVPAAAVSTSPEQIRPSSREMAPVSSFTMNFDHLLGDFQSQVDSMLRPPPRPRKVYGGAQSIAGGHQLLLPPASPPPKVYSVHNTGTHRLAAMRSLSASSLPLSRCGGAAMHCGFRGAPSHTPTRLASCGSLGSVGLHDSLDSATGGFLRSPNRSDGSLLREGSPTAPRLLQHGLRGTLLRDGLTPGQRALGATGNDRHAACSALVARYGRPVMLPPRLPPKPAVRASRQAAESVLAVATRTMEVRRQKLFTSAAWLAAEEADKAKRAAKMVSSCESRAAPLSCVTAPAVAAAART